jgi:hypothetical protein
MILNPHELSLTPVLCSRLFAYFEILQLVLAR